ncbi:hypothetical protein HJFPF1_00897 [Paramyrothecium foliicola]|nr:hypothetical protein HJFPF1_00897 [Paramyrothecium foliicola]
MQSYYRPQHALTVDTSHAQKFFDETDKAVLEESIIDHSALDSGLELSPPMADSRRESFAVGGSALFSPKTEDWQSVDMQSVPSNNPFLDQHSNNPFLRMEHSQSYGSQANAWTMNHSASVPAGLQHFDSMPGDFDANASIFQHSMQGQTPFGNAANIFGALGPANQSMPASPQKEWVASAQALNKKMPPNSPAIRSHNDLRRGDGIRKKNARFDIPAERNLSNIDHLISQSTDDQEIKELKQQKRLLRNRQAAYVETPAKFTHRMKDANIHDRLDSRQRKKLHTERLEDEKKQYTGIISEMEDEITSLKTKIEQLLIDKQSCVDYIETMTMEKDEMIRAHTIETGELRKRLGVLTEHIQHYESAAPSTVSGAHAFPGVFDGMEGMAMGGSWDNTGVVTDYHVDPEPPKQEMSLVPSKSEDEKGASQGSLLFMLFLVGAFVMSSRSTPSIPRVSEDVRVASATLLNNVLKDAGVNGHPSGVQALAPQPSGSAWMEASGSSVGHMHMNDMGVDNVAPSMLAELGDSLTRPTEDQTHEQIFSISAAQYNGVSDQNFMQNAPERSTSQGRKNLADALAAMRATTKQTGAADVYTRSLLWDQIPSDVVRNFAKMFVECNNVQNEQQCNEART